MNAIEAILSFDGKHVDQLRSALSSEMSSIEWDEFVAFLDHENLRYQTASTWMMKAALEQAIEQPIGAKRAFVDAGGRFSGWEPRLHLLQSVRLMDLDDQRIGQVKKLAQNWASDQKTLVRVWSLDVLVRLNANDPSQSKVVAELLRSALEDDAGSMKARARNLIKEFPQFS